MSGFLFLVFNQFSPVFNVLRGQKWGHELRKELSCSATSSRLLSYVCIYIRSLRPKTGKRRRMLADFTYSLSRGMFTAQQKVIIDFHATNSLCHQKKPLRAISLQRRFLYALKISVVRDFLWSSVGSLSLPFFKSAVIQCNKNHPSERNTNCSSYSSAFFRCSGTDFSTASA